MTKKRGLRAAQLLALTLVLLLLCACGKVDHNEDESSNLGHWGRALASLSMQTLGGNPVVFGGELAEDTVASALEIRDIETRDQLLEAVSFRLEHGAREDYHFDADVLTAYDEQELEAALSELDETQQAHYRRVLAVAERWGEDGLLAVDAAEAALLLQLGYDAGLLTHEEAQALVEPVAQMVLGHFTSWEELLQNLLDGRCVTDGLDEGSEALQAMTERLDALREGDDDKDPLFDDALFSEQLVPLEGVSASSLLP